MFPRIAGLGSSRPPSTRWIIFQRRTVPQLFRSSSAQKTKVLQVDPADIGKIIGKGGETVRGLVADFRLANVIADDEGVVTITGGDETQVDACAARIAELVVDVDSGR